MKTPSKRITKGLTKASAWAVGSMAALLLAAAPSFAQHGGGGGGHGGGGGGGGHSMGGGGGHMGGGFGGHVGFSNHASFAGRAGFAGGGYVGARGYAGPHVGGYAPHVGYSVRGGSSYVAHPAFAGRAGYVGHPGYVGHAAYGYGWGRAGWGWHRPYWGGGYWHGGFWPRAYYWGGYPWFLGVLPGVYATYWWGGIPYYYANDLYYTWNPAYNGYVVTDPPPTEDSGAADGNYENTDPGTSSAAPGPGAPGTGGAEVYAYPKSGQTEEQQATDKYECHKWAVAQSGYDPTQPSRNGSITDYHRAMAACMDGRGYSAN